MAPENSEPNPIFLTWLFDFGMARKPRTTKFTILIVCEGTATEPNYFKGLADEVKTFITEFEDFIVEVDPKPKDDQVNSSAPSPHKSARKKRQLQHRDTIIEGEIEPQYAADPVRYVRTAQLGLLDGTYEEAYAVFDKDDHPKRKEAYDLAEEEVNGKKVQIGFSSISFEHWVLLHFELNVSSFEKSECKDGGVYLGCGVPKDTIGCKGERCVVGHIREQEYHPYNKNGRTLWKDLRGRLTSAFRNAAILRHQQLLAHPDVPTYDRNPYCDLDLVISRILRLPSFVATGIGQPIVLQEIEYIVDLAESGKVAISIRNIQDKTQVITSNIWFSDGFAEKISASNFRKLLQPEAICTFEKEIPTSLDQPSRYINFEIGEEVILTVSLG
jgi:hypothetical protein